jgi:endonuclease/exonuclease/phosphatase family metal-dependent hydrolase
MQLITWNVQWCRGCDGAVDPGRIARVARGMADFDVLCLQEVARHFAGLDGSAGEDQFRLLAAALPGYTLIEGVATDRSLPAGARMVPGSVPRRQFGNAILTRLPVLQVFRHLLPWPADAGVPSMQRIALEVVLAAPGGPLRVTTTHLEYYSSIQRMAQVERLRQLQAEAAGHAHDSTLGEKAGGPFEAAPRPASGLLTADFNFRPGSAEYHRLQAAQDGDAPRYVDAWPIAHRGVPHASTVGVHDKAQWPEDPFCFDMIFVTDDLVPRVRDVSVNTVADASDHQPVLLRLDH